MRYRSLIVFRLGGWSPRLPTGFLVSRGTLVSAVQVILRLRDCHPLWSRFPSLFGSSSSSPCRPATPNLRRHSVWPLTSSLAATGVIEFSFFSSGYLDVSVPRVPSYVTMDSSHGDGGSHRRVSPFGNPWLKACLRLPMAYRSLLRPSSAISGMASTLCSYYA